MKFSAEKSISLEVVARKFLNALYASDHFHEYEQAARILEMFAILTTILLLISLLPKYNIYTSEINSVIDMIFFGIRYLFVLVLLFLGLWFIGQNMFRRTLQNNRHYSIRANDYDAEHTQSTDIPFATGDAFSVLARAPFGLLNSPSEVYAYMLANRNDETYDHEDSIPVTVFWMIFFILIVLIGFNGLVAFMTANLSMGNFDEKLAESRQPANIMRYNLSKLQPKHQRWPIPFNFLLMVYAMFEWVWEIATDKSAKEDEVSVLDQDVPPATKKVRKVLIFS